MKVESVKLMIMAQDMNRAIHFWSKAFGFRVQFQDEHWSEVDSLAEAVLAVRDAGGTIVRDPESRPGEPIQLAEAEDTECNRFSLVQYIG